MAAVELANQFIIGNGDFAGGTLTGKSLGASAEKKKSCERERRRWRRKQKKNDRKYSDSSEYGGVEWDSEEGKVESGAKGNSDSYTEVRLSCVDILN